MPVTGNAAIPTPPTGAAGIALWRHVADELEQAIFQGAYDRSQKLPSENEIAIRFGCNRHTVRRAIAEMAARGLVRAERGSGTYLQQPRIAYPISRRTRFSENVGGAGSRSGGRLLNHATEPAPPDVASHLDVAPDTAVVRLDLVRTASGTPVCVASTWFAPRLGPRIAAFYRQTRSITRTLERCGVADYQRRWSRIGAGFADAHDARQLGLTPNRPLLLVESLDVALDGQPLLATKARFAADRITLTIDHDPGQPQS
jgi:GntR family phosphonate transport system transcriptional regulator